jgi:hypothetical protein
VKLKGDITINSKLHRAGEELPWTSVYPFFLVHMLMFGSSGFFMAYTNDGPVGFFLYAHGGIAIPVYLIFYLSIFGREEVKWMVINAALGFFGIYGEMGWLLSLFGKTLGSYPAHVHVIPFLYYVLYTFLLRQAVLDVTGARANETRRQAVDRCYVVLSVCFYSAFYFL